MKNGGDVVHKFADTMAKAVFSLVSEKDDDEQDLSPSISPTKWNNRDPRAYYVPSSPNLRTNTIPPAILGLYEEKITKTAHHLIPVPLNYTPPNLSPQNKVAKGFFAYVQFGQNLMLSLHANSLSKLTARSPTQSVLARLQWDGQDSRVPEIARIAREIVFRAQGNAKYDGLAIPFKLLPSEIMTESGKSFHKTVLNIVFYAAERIVGAQKQGKVGKLEYEEERYVYLNDGEFRAGAVLQGLTISLMLIGVLKKNKVEKGGPGSVRRSKAKRKRDAIEPTEILSCFDDEAELIEAQVPLKRRRTSTD